MVTTVSAGKMRNRIGDILARIRYANEHIVIQRRGKPVAAVISIEEYRLFLELREKQRLKERRERFAGLREAATHSDMPEEEALALAQKVVNSIRHSGDPP